MSKPNEPIPCRLLLEAGWVLPVAPENTALEHHAVAIDGDRILEVGPREALRERYQPQQHLVWDEAILTPGLINGHAHSGLSLLRGIAEDLPLQRWLQEQIWPLEGQLVNETFVRTGTNLAIAEMLGAGITCFTDMYFFPEIGAICAQEAGIRAQLAFPIFEGANAWADSAADCFHKGLALHDTYRDDALITTAFGPHAPYTVSRENLERVHMYAQEIGIGVHIHLHENAEEVSEARRTIGGSYIDLLQSIGLINPQLQAVHMTQMTAADIELFADAGAHIVHCPASNMKLASGACPIDAILDAGVTLALGTDSAASNNSLNLLTDARLAALLAKHSTQRADAGSVHALFEAATLGGARAMGREADLGSLEAGKLADLAVFQATGPGAMPMYDPFAALIHTDAWQATDVWVAGEPVLTDRQPTRIDMEMLNREVGREQARAIEVEEKLR